MDKKQEEKDIMDVEKARNLLDIFREDLLEYHPYGNPSSKINLSVVVAEKGCGKCHLTQVNHPTQVETMDPY